MGFWMMEIIQNCKILKLFHCFHKQATCSFMIGYVLLHHTWIDNWEIFTIRLRFPICMQKIRWEKSFFTLDCYIYFQSKAKRFTCNPQGDINRCCSNLGGDSNRNFSATKMDSWFVCRSRVPLYSDKENNVLSVHGEDNFFQ